MEGSLKRVLLMERGTLARRSVAVWKQFDVETVLAFGTEDADASWLDEADYAVWHGGAVGQAEPARLISAAMDAGCEALDPGTLADDLDLLDLALRANLAVVGCDLHRAAKYRDPNWIVAQAGEAEVPAAPIGPWEESPSLRRRVDVWVIRDRRGGRVALGAVEGTVAPPGQPAWLLELGQVPGAAARETLIDFSLRVAGAVGGPGLLRVRWGYLDETAWALRGLSSAVGPGWPLIDAIHGVDPLYVRVAGWLGGAGMRDTLHTDRHGVLARIVARRAGALESIELPEGALAECEPGDPVSAGQPVAQVVCTAPTRQAALVRLRTDLERVRIQGVDTGLDALLDLLGGRALWDGQLDAQRAAAALASTSDT